MSANISRRTFVRTSAAAGVAFAAPAVLRGASPRPIVVASANGHRFKNGGPRTCVEEAYARIERGEDPLDAVIAGVSLVELDPAEDSVGYGGLPNADGIVQLDAACMDGTRRRAGAVAALEGVRTPSSVARAVMAHTDHHLLVGRDAQTFARRMGFAVEDDLNTEHSRRLWLEWKRRIDPDHWLDPDRRAAAAERARNSMITDGLLRSDRVHGTIHCSALGPKGEIVSVTSTSGLAWKVPGRVGDSPILGAGLYADGRAGSAGSTGRGEANLFGLGSFVVVESMRRGMGPKDAVLEALRRIRDHTLERHLLNTRGLPAFNVKFYALSVGGEHASAGLYAGDKDLYAVCDPSGPRLLPVVALLPGSPRD